MSRAADIPVDDIHPDPFAERTSSAHEMDVHLLGCRVRFSSDSAALMEVVAMAYAGLPSHVLPVDPPPLRIELRLSPRLGVDPMAEPPAVRMQSGAGFLCGVMDEGNYAVLFPSQRCGLVVASPERLAQPYHLRYELLEFAVFTLATRALALAPLHGACIGRHGKAVLVMGLSGAGKSTLALHALLRGLDFLSEDAVFVHTDSARATGVSNYLHVTPDALRFVDDDAHRRWIEHSPTIRRRSGVEKYEVDLRHGHGRLAQAPLALAGVVFASASMAADPDRLLLPMPAEDIAVRLAAEQPYAASQAGWDALVRLVHQRGAYELRRGRHPDDAVDAVLRLLD